MYVKKLISLLLSLLIVIALPVQALAADYDIADGSVVITSTADSSSQTVTHGGVDKGVDANPTVTGTSTTNTVTITGGGTANVTLKDVNIDTSSGSGSAVTVDAGTSANVKLEGTNKVTSASGSAGVEVSEDASVTISESTKTETLDSLAATGGSGGAGIGGSSGQSAGTITIESGDIKAYGNGGGAGIGGGAGGGAGTVHIAGGNVTAESSGSLSLNFSGGKPTFVVSSSGAGIGSGSDAPLNAGGSVTISGDTTIVNAESIGANGIGNGLNTDGVSVVITGGTVDASGSYGADGLDVDSVKISGNATVTNNGEAFYTPPQVEPDPKPDSDPVPTPQPNPVEEKKPETAKPVVTAPVAAAPAATVIVEAEKPVEATISGTAEEVRIWLSGEKLEATDVLLADSAEVKELTESVAPEKVVGVYSLALKSGKVELKNNTLNFNLGVKYAGQVFTLVYYFNGERMEIDGTVGQNGVLSFPLKQVTVIMLVQK